MQILRAESLKTRNTLALDASAAGLVRAESSEDIDTALQWAQAEGLPVLPMGEGSNVVLVSDLQALVICQDTQSATVMAERNGEVSVRVSAGYNWHRLVGDTLARGWYGLENLALIPGQVGAAPIQNIGAYGVEVERFVSAVHGIHLDTGERFTLDSAACHFGYRDSVFKRELRDRVLITAVDFNLSTRPSAHVAYPALQEELACREVKEPTPEDVFAAVVAVRSRRLPAPQIEPNAGSFFKNPVVGGEHADALRSDEPLMPGYEQDDGSVKIPAAWLIEQCGWKGRAVGDVSMHSDHALVLVNRGNATGAEVLAYARGIVESVQQRFGISLEMEPRIYGAGNGQL